MRAAVVEQEEIGAGLLGCQDLGAGRVLEPDADERVVRELEALEGGGGAAQDHRVHAGLGGGGRCGGILDLRDDEHVARGALGHDGAEAETRGGSADVTDAGAELAHRGALRAAVPIPSGRSGAGIDRGREVTGAAGGT